jgi:polar amino acid transport system ATP-binding protein
MINDPLMRLDNVAKAYGDNQVFKNLSFSIQERNSVVVQGPSGCGKTTLLRCMALLESIDEGRVDYEGIPVVLPHTKPEPPRRIRLAIGMVFQHLHLWPHLTVLDNVSLPLRLASGISRARAEEKAREVLNLLKIDHKDAEYPFTLSGGQQQRVALARALVHTPKLLMLDEITANLDQASATRVLSAVEEISNRGTTIVLASHSELIPNSLRQVIIRYDNGRWKLTDS